MRRVAQLIGYSGLVALLQCATPSTLMAAEEYRLGPGDTIDVTVAGAPELQRKAQIGSDGSLSLPVIGRVEASGLTLTELQANLQQSFSTRSVRQRAAGGTETIFAIRPEDVAVDVAQYAPVYILGAVARPGELSFRPLMTVRQAVALAGGFEPLHGRGPSSVLEVMELETESLRLGTEIGQVQLQAARLNAELAGHDNLDPLERILSSSQISALTAAYNLERERLKVNRTNFMREKEATAALIQNTERQVTQLAQQRRQQEQLLSQEESELAETKELYRGKVVSLPRVNEAQRGVSTAVERLQQTSIQLLQAERSLDELRRQLVRLEDQKRAQLLGELQEAQTKLRELQAREEALLLRLNLLRGSLAQIRRERFNLDVQIFRRDATETRQIKGTEDTLLIPRDLIDVTFEQRATTTAPPQMSPADPAQAPNRSAPALQQRNAPNAQSRR